MSASKKDLGTIQTILNRLNEERIPRALQLRRKVNDGENLSDHDKAFLKRVYEDSAQLKTLVANHPEYATLYARVASLYTAIVNTAIENEKKKDKV